MRPYYQTSTDFLHLIEPVQVSASLMTGDKKLLHVQSDEYRNNILLSEVITVHNTRLREQDQGVNWLR